MTAHDRAVATMEALVRAEQDRGIRMGLRYAALALERMGLEYAALRLKSVQPSRVRAKVAP